MDKKVNKSLHTLSIRSDMSQITEINLDNYSSWNVQNFTEILNRPKVYYIKRRNH
jgi:hypothetical protein